MSLGEGTAESEEDDDVAEEGAEGEGDAGEAPVLQVRHTCHVGGGQDQLDDSPETTHLRQTEECL